MKKQISVILQTVLWQLHWQLVPAAGVGKATGLAEVSMGWTGSNDVCKAGCVRCGDPCWGSWLVWSQYPLPTMSAHRTGAGKTQTEPASPGYTWKNPQCHVSWQIICCMINKSVSICFFYILTYQLLLGSWQQIQNTRLHHLQLAWGHNSCSIATKRALE